jgi:hypothetical protein
VVSRLRPRLLGDFSDCSFFETLRRFDPLTAVVARRIRDASNLTVSSGDYPPVFDEQNAPVVVDHDRADPAVVPRLDGSTPTNSSASSENVRVFRRTSSRLRMSARSIMAVNHTAMKMSI